MLEFRGGLVLTSRFKEFGGISAIRVQPDGAHFIAATDKGWWLRGRITSNPDIIATELRGWQREFCVHLRSADCRQMLISHRGQKCHVVFTHTKGRRAHFSRIHHISDRQIFRECLGHLRWRMGLKNRTALLAIDARLFEGPLPVYSKETHLAQVALYRSKTLRPEQIDNLYSEVTLLGL